MQCISVVCSWNRSTTCKVSLNSNKSKGQQQSPSNKVMGWALFSERPLVTSNFRVGWVGPKSSKIIGRHLWTFPYRTDTKIEFHQVLVLFIGNYFEQHSVQIDSAHIQHCFINFKIFEITTPYRSICSSRNISPQDLYKMILSKGVVFRK